MSFGTIVIAAGLCGLLSFTLLAVAIGSDYWYIIEVDPANHTTSEDRNSHSGLWRIYEGKNGSFHDIYSFNVDTSNHTEREKHLLNLHRVTVILLPLSLVLLVFGGICGLAGSLARSKFLLTGTASYLLICSLLTISAVSVYISLSQQALEDLQHMADMESLSHMHVSFGWSLAVACLSFCLELTTGALLILAAKIAYTQYHNESTVAISMA
ncbi:transmembrane protein 235 [Chanos chanos]|uniref:Transmembrane protein 235 n=1 Tax=Chanos chanos TaxID=29144 RepID=A0A6J2WPY5_CHACN|nr:transmembrane protein 235-like [Chanos chanos]